jgi:hypothetical protein
MNATERLTPTSSPGTDRWVMWSWLMLPMLLVSTVAAVVFEVWVLSTAGLEGSEPMSEQGLTGVVAIAVGNLIIWAMPAYVGIWLGRRASAAGAPNAAWPMRINALAVAGIWLLSLYALLQG